MFCPDIAVLIYIVFIIVIRLICREHLS